MRAGDIVDGRFELVEIAGEGGMGVVWRTLDRARGATVALKVVHGDGRELAMRFAREARVLRELSHPGIVAYVADGVTERGAPWLAMEWLEGEDLAARLTRGPLSGEASLAVARAIAEALAHAHDRGLVHRDLKPSNVWLVEGDPARAKLLDFGVVRRLDPSASLGRTRAGAMVGTPGYMAPEQARGEQGIDARADLYALGCVLFECVTGRPAFVGEHVMALLAKVLLEEPPRMSSVARVPAALDALVGALLEKDPARRPRDAREVARALSALDVFEVGRATTMVSAGASLIREQQWVIVLAVDTGSLWAEDATLQSDSTPPEAYTIVRAAADTGARLEGLAGGAQILLWQTSDAPAEMAARAARAALAIQATLPVVPMSLASGRAAVGGAVPVGEALERAAAGLRRAHGQIALDGSMARLLEGAFSVALSDGRPALLAERARTHGARTLLGKWTPHVGRDVELSTLTAVLAEVADESIAAAVIVTGDTGIGKSRLASEWLRAAQLAGPELRVWQAHGDPMREGASFGVVADLARDACGVGLGASRAEARARIAEAVAAIVDPPHRARVASRLCELCGAPWETDVDSALMNARRDPIVMGDQLRAAWEDLLVAACARHPLVLWIEGLQWADAPSVSLIDRALRNFHDRPWMVLGLGRPEHRARHPKLWTDRGVRDLSLGPLKDRAAEKLVRAVLGRELPEERLRSLVGRAGGNAYFLEELIRAESEARGDQTPETVLAMVEARLLRLDAASRRVLRAASVLGARFDARAVAAVLNEPSATEALEALVRQEWLTTGSGGYAFRQETSREAAYAMLVEEDRRLAHERAAEWFAASVEADPAAVAEHYERALAPERAARWWARASTAALEANDYRACVLRAESAERCGAIDDVLGEALAARAEAHYWLGEVALQCEVSARLGAWAAAAGDPALAATALRHTSVGAARAGQTEVLRRAVEDMTRCLTEHASSDEVVFCALRVASTARVGGLSEASDALAGRVDAVVPPLASRSDLVVAAAEHLRALRAHHDHDLETYAVGCRSAAEHFERAGDIRRAAGARGSAGYALVLLGAYSEAASALEASLAGCERMGMRSQVATMQQNLGLALAGLGRYEEALAVERAATEAFVLAGNKLNECAARFYTARILLAAGRVAEAVEEGERAAALLPEAHPFTLDARVALADALLARGQGTDAVAALAHAEAARSALRADPARFEEPAPILRVYVDALRANGLSDEAERAGEDARAWVRESAAKIRSARYRLAFLREERDVARMMGHADPPRDE
jgi:hypothetical protein